MSPGAPAPATEPAAIFIALVIAWALLCEAAYRALGLLREAEPEHLRVEPHHAIMSPRWLDRLEERLARIEDRLAATAVTAASAATAMNARPTPPRLPAASLSGPVAAESEYLRVGPDHEIDAFRNDFKQERRDVETRVHGLIVRQLDSDEQVPGLMVSCSESADLDSFDGNDSDWRDNSDGSASSDGSDHDDDIVSSHRWLVCPEKRVPATTATAPATARQTPHLHAGALPPAPSTAGRGSTGRVNPTRDQHAAEVRLRQHDVGVADLRPRRVGARIAQPDSRGEPREDHQEASAAAASASSLRPLCSPTVQPPPPAPRRASPETAPARDLRDDLLSPDSSPAGTPVVGDPRIAACRGLDMDAFWEKHG